MAELQTKWINVGTDSGFVSQYGFGQAAASSSNTQFGSIANSEDGTLNVNLDSVYSGADVRSFVYVALSGFENTTLTLTGNRANSGWDTVSIGSTTLNRSDATHSYNSNGNFTSWNWSGSTNYFGITNNDDYEIVFDDGVAATPTAPTDITFGPDPGTYDDQVSITATASGGSNGTMKVSENGTTWLANGSSFTFTRNTAKTIYARTEGSGSNSSNYPESHTVDYLDPKTTGISVSLNPSGDLAHNYTGDVTVTISGGAANNRYRVLRTTGGNSGRGNTGILTGTSGSVGLHYADTGDLPTPNQTVNYAIQGRVDTAKGGDNNYVTTNATFSITRDQTPTNGSFSLSTSTITEGGSLTVQNISTSPSAGYHLKLFRNSGDSPDNISPTTKTWTGTSTANFTMSVGNQSASEIGYQGESFTWLLREGTDTSAGWNSGASLDSASFTLYDDEHGTSVSSSSISIGATASSFSVGVISNWSGTNTVAARIRNTTTDTVVKTFNITDNNGTTNVSVTSGLPGQGASNNYRVEVYNGNEYLNGATFSVSKAAPSYSVTAPTSINEGSSGTISVSTTGVPNNTTLYYTVTPSGDFGTSSGSFTITNNAGSFSVSPAADSTTEGAETATVSIRTGSTSGTVVATDTFTINDTSTTPPSYSVTAPTSINEGSAGTISVSTSNVANNTTLYYTVTPSGDFGTSSGSFTITNNAGSFTLTPSADNTTEGAETATVRIRTGSTSGTVVATDTFTINDTSTTPVPTYSVTAPTSINEGSAGTISVSTSNVGNGTTLYWSVIPSGDFGTSSGTVSISSNAASFTVTPTADSTTEGAETATVRIRTGSQSGTIVATDTFTINDTSTECPTTNTTHTITGITGGSSQTLSQTSKVTSGNNLTISLTTPYSYSTAFNPPSLSSKKSVVSASITSGGGSRSVGQSGTSATITYTPPYRTTQGTAVLSITHSEFRAVADPDAGGTLTWELDHIDTVTLTVTICPQTQTIVNITSVDTVTPNENTTDAVTATVTTPAGVTVSSYSWSTTGQITLSSNSVETPTLTFGNVTSDSSASVSVTVTDSNGNTASDTQNYTIQFVNQNPVAIIQGPSSTDVNSSVTYSGSDSYDPDGQTVQYQWSASNGGESFSQAKSSNSSFSFTPTETGSYTVTLTAHDSAGGTNVTTKSLLSTSTDSENTGSAGGFGFEIYAANGDTILRADELLIRKAPAVTLNASGAASTSITGTESQTTVLGIQGTSNESSLSISSSGTTTKSVSLSGGAANTRVSLFLLR